MTSALSASFGGMTGGTVSAGGVSWWAVVLESFQVALFPQLQFAPATYTVMTLSVTPQINMPVTSTSFGAFNLSVKPQVSMTTPMAILVFTPTISMPGVGAYGPEFFTVAVTPAVQFAIWHPPGQLNTPAVLRAATR